MGDVEEMSSTEIQGWIEYFDIYPFTQDREDLRAAQISCMINRMLGGKAKLENLIPVYLKPDRELEVTKSLEQQMKDAEAWKQQYLEATKRN